MDEVDGAGRNFCTFSSNFFYTFCTFSRSFPVIFCTFSRCFIAILSFLRPVNSRITAKETLSKMDNLGCEWIEWIDIGLTILNFLGTQTCHLGLGELS